jgi:hypothetical protein
MSGRHSFVSWRRLLALQESWALRALYRQHGYIPAVSVNQWDVY